MRLRLTPRALADAKRMKTWWRRHRSKAEDLFEQELDAALERIMMTPNLGSVYEPGNLDCSRGPGATPSRLGSPSAL
jgi:plasmid stabilization system protein ParE